MGEVFRQSNVAHILCLGEGSGRCSRGGGEAPRVEGARDTVRMDRFDCKGFLYISATKTSPLMSITIRHDERHLAYSDSELPARWKAYIEEHALSRTAGEVRSSHLIIVAGSHTVLDLETH